MERVSTIIMLKILFYKTEHNLAISNKLHTKISFNDFYLNIFVT